MRKVITLMITASILFVCSCGSSTDKNNKESLENLSGTISVSGAFALYPLAQKWAEEFQKLHPKVRIDVSAGGAGKGMTDALSELVSLGMVSREVSKEEIAKGAWYIAVAKDAVVPIINDYNPAIQKLANNGLSKATLQDVYVNGKITDWGNASGDKKVKDKINIYTRADACGAADVWAKFLGKKQEDLLGTAVSGDPGVTEAVKNDKNAIGYNNIAYAYDAKTKLVISGIAIVPIDFNGNGIIDDKEYFYQTKDSVLKAIADGRYPSPLARDLYFVSKGKPTNKVAKAFLDWIMTDGQKYVAEAGYFEIPKAKLATEYKKLQ